MSINYIDELNREAEKMFPTKWRSEPPTEPGFYWLYYKDQYTEEMSAVEVTKVGVYELGHGLSTPLSQYSPDYRWLGPIPKPKAPNS